jgi:membrane protease YdiL (CAAX protease family)
MDGSFAKVLVPVVAGGALLVASRRRRLSWRDDLGIAPPPAARSAAWIAVWLAWMLGTDLAMGWRGPWDFGPWVRAGVLASALRVLAVGVLGPIVEELLFRGFLLHRLQVRMGTRGAVAVTAALWAAIHLGYPLPVVLLLFGSGLLLGAARVNCRSVIVPVVMHVIWNLYAVW